MVETGKMFFDYSKLNGKIKERFNTQGAFARALGISTTSLSKKLHNKTEFTQSEITRAKSLLDIDATEPYFFEKITKKT